MKAKAKMTKREMQKQIKKITKWLQNQVVVANAKGVVIGLSGGIDSSVVAVICKKVFKENVLGLILPCESNKQDKTDAISLARKFKISYKVLDLKNLYDNFCVLTHNHNKNILAHANIKPRLRMTMLYYYANLKNYLVIGTDNKSELLTGYFTKYGDGGVDLLPIADFYKTEIFEMARFLDIPIRIINKLPSAGLWDNQTDEDEMGLSYDELDATLMGGWKSMPIAITTIVADLVKNSIHKRKLPPIYKR